MNSIRYVCEGGCRSMITEDEHISGRKQCSADGCENYGRPFLRTEYCSHCNTTFDEGEEHVCIS